MMVTRKYQRLPRKYVSMMAIKISRKTLYAYREMYFMFIFSCLDFSSCGFFGSFSRIESSSRSNLLVSSRRMNFGSRRIRNSLIKTTYLLLSSPKASRIWVSGITAIRSKKNQVHRYLRAIFLNEWITSWVSLSRYSWKNRRMMSMAKQTSMQLSKITSPFESFGENAKLG